MSLLTEEFYLYLEIYFLGKMWGSDNDLLNYSDSTESLYNQSNPLSLQDHIQEVLNKWQSIDDEIWAKIIVLERNRRVAKAYARAPVLTVNGSDDGFDGFRIGLAGFDNPMRDAKTEDVKRHIGQVRQDRTTIGRI